MEKTPYVGPLLRIVASVYDFFLLLGVWFLVGSIALWLNGGKTLNPALGMLLVFLSGWAFYAYFWIKSGQTLGMQVWKIKLVNPDLQILSWQECFSRLFFALVSISMLGLGFIWMLFDPERLTWHDRASGTRVILLRKDKSES